MISAIFEHLEERETCSTLEEVRTVLDQTVDGGDACLRGVGRIISY